jgi:hypothetical protein
MLMEASVVETNMRRLGNPDIVRSGRNALKLRTAVKPPPPPPVVIMPNETQPPTTTAKSNALHPSRKYTPASLGPKTKFRATTKVRNSIVNTTVNIISAVSKLEFQLDPRASNGLYNANVKQLATIVANTPRSNHTQSLNRLAQTLGGDVGPNTYSDFSF